MSRSGPLPPSPPALGAPPRLADWVEAENKVTFDYLKAIPQRESIQKRLTELWNYERYSAPFKNGGRYFYTRTDGLQNQAVLYTAEKLDVTIRFLSGLMATS